jgi:hypothetical protein
MARLNAARPKTRLAGPVLGAQDPIALAGFYAELLGWPVVETETQEVDGVVEGWAKIRSPHTGVKIEFQYEPHYVAPVWPPEAGEQQMLSHLDIGVEDLTAGVAYALALGARESGYQPAEGVRVLRDPEGQLFCLFPDPTAATEG